ncbi:N-acetylglucosamine kinase [Pedococcus bigeumensis]|uniref:N-acetylglucosamine kinase n=1 Tax=Pedococcus bigeumensis TaxID=433644 RepID=UPI0013872C9C|nr:BadF/BadG/BcrA/BcrD ATPase family protein [Pedococcus bigeumensis]
MNLVIGLDVGGTSSRALVADLAGRRVGVGMGGGGNPLSRGVEPAVRAIRSALEQALVGVDPNAVAGNVIGAAGFGSRSPAHGALGEMWSDLGLPGSPVIGGDAEVAFASGTADLDGSVLISGTGAVASHFVDGMEVGVADGLGWLLGDHGSGFWIGREAVRHCLGLAYAPDGVLAPAVAQALLGRPDATRSDLIAATYSAAPVRVSELARAVVTAQEAGSVAAASILTAAADKLVETLALVRAPGAQTVVVLAGGMLQTAHLRAGVRGRVAARWPGSVIARSGSGAAGAAWLALRRLGVDLPLSQHATLTAAP